ncbi:hypothetical protein [Photobacterium phosphoreum]|uniref:hypothetical protein n=1 Tax=Photobacterium phosphoreum TaxID=659 RepID=UPI00242ED301|nr:hypothetical protein [Photobacterium phosphoreum]
MTLSKREFTLFCDEMNFNAIDKRLINRLFTIVDQQAITGRQLTTETLKNINHDINSIPTGEQRYLRQLLSQLCLYLQQRCDWDIPESQDKKCLDLTLEWMQRINEQAYDASVLYNDYLSYRKHFFTERPTITPALITVAFSIEVAPLAHVYLCQILNTPPVIEYFDEQLTIILFHDTGKKTQRQDKTFTRYALIPFVYRLLQDYHRVDHNDISPKQLNNQLNHFLTSAPYSLTEKAKHSWHYCFLNIWHHQKGYPHVLLQDISQPNRHVSFHYPTVNKLQAQQDLSIIYYNNTPYTPTVQDSPPSLQTGWPHKDLLKDLDDIPPRKRKDWLQQHPPKVPMWMTDNVLPKLFFHFTYDLLFYGGVQSSYLDIKSIKKYTSIYQPLSTTTLTYDIACDPDALAQWAQDRYNTTNENDKWLVYNFFRYLSHIDITDHFDIRAFNPPTQPKSVNAFRINVSQYQQLLDALLIMPGATPLQRLFCVGSLVLGFYAGLRRGEVLRLRSQDIVASKNCQQSFIVHITTTKEGHPKNNKHRQISVYLPKAQAALLHEILLIKCKDDLSSPFIGYENEAISSRAHYYLLPITRALKALFGKKACFHHLRHSAAHLLTQQGLLLATQDPTMLKQSNNRSGEHSAAFSLYSDERVHQQLDYQYSRDRFNFWLEDRPFSAINDSLLFDVCSDQWGHSSYTTTRRSYLHGVEWLPRFFCGVICYEYDELCYLLAIKPYSNDIFRFINTLKATYSTMVQSHTAVSLNEQALMQLLIDKKPFKHLVNDACSPLILTTTTDIEPLKRWKQHSFETIQYCYLADNKKMTKCVLFHYQSTQLFDLINAGTLPFSTISAFWMMTGGHQPTQLSKSQFKSLKQLGQLSINSDNQSLALTTRCTLHNATLFTQLFRMPFFGCFTFSFLLKHNKKRPVTNNKILVNKHFSKKDEHTKIDIIQQGKTQLIIDLQFNLDSPWLLQSVFEYLKQ